MSTSVRRVPPQSYSKKLGRWSEDEGDDNDLFSDARSHVSNHVVNNVVTTITPDQTFSALDRASQQKRFTQIANPQYIRDTLSDIGQSRSSNNSVSSRSPRKSHSRKASTASNSSRSAIYFESNLQSALVEYHSSNPTPTPNERSKSQQMDRPLVSVSLLANEHRQVSLSSSSEDENAHSVFRSNIHSSRGPSTPNITSQPVNPYSGDASVGSIHSSSRYQIVDSVTGHIYTIPDHVAGRSTLNHLLQEWMNSGQCSVVGSVNSSSSSVDPKAHNPRFASDVCLGSSSQAQLPETRPLAKTVQTSPQPLSTNFSNFSSHVTEAHANSLTPYGSHFVPMLHISTRRHAHKGPIWILKMNSTGQYLASAGSDGIIFIWEVGMYGSKHDENKDSVAEKAKSNKDSDLDIKVLSQEPYRKYDEHSGQDVIDLSWSPSDFLLSASMDRTIKLFHISKRSSLRTFEHPDFVTSVDFNPVDDNIFLSGSFDRKVRLWNIARNEVVDWAQAPDIVTCARFHPSAKTIVAGLIKGQVYIYSAKRGLQYLTQISCINRHGLRSDGRKVTGLEFRKVTKVVKVKLSKPRQADETSSASSPFNSHSHASESSKIVASPVIVENGAAEDPHQGGGMRKLMKRKKKVLRRTHQLLVTTNDSRIRIYGMEDFCMIQKMRGLRNLSMQIKAQFSESGNAVTCGSEDGCVFIWESKVMERKKTKTTAREKMGLFTEHLRSKQCAAFQARDPLAGTAAITATCFLPEISAARSLSLDCDWKDPKFRMRLNEDPTTAFILSSDYEGTIKVFMRRSFLDSLNNALNQY